MQYMRSVEAPGEVGGAPADIDDRTARARIRDAAIGLFAEHGVARTSVRAIAAAADVSASLVMHHFGSKDNLRVACDQHVAATIRRHKTAAMGAGLSLDPVAALREADGDAPLLRYLARTLVDGSPHVSELVEEMAADAAEYMEQGVQAGILKPSAYPTERAALLTVWSLGALVLHEHLSRLLGVDITTDLGDPVTAQRYLLPAMEIHTNGTITEEMATRLREAMAPAEGQTPP